MARERSTRSAPAFPRAESGRRHHHSRHREGKPQLSEPRKGKIVPNAASPGKRDPATSAILIMTPASAAFYRQEDWNGRRHRARKSRGTKGVSGADSDFHDVHNKV
jgi:hypothetical protein